jgi:hypothetical protein
MPQTKKTAEKRILTLKVALKNRTSIWRRIAIRSDQSLEQLHDAIFDAFDRDDEHLYSFYLPQPGSRGEARIRTAAEYTHPACVEDAGPFGSNARNAAKTCLVDLILTKGQKFDYLFDFGDDWWHDITVEVTDGESDGGKYPRIVERKGESPPQYPSDDDEFEE